jgi:uncharacterized protein
MSDAEQEWFTEPDATGKAGLSFACTMCGNCCTGPEGYILVNEEEIEALAKRLGLPRDEFVERYTHKMYLGRSLNEKLTSFGQDCVFLDREKIPGKAVCGVYEDRPRQCRTWPFWRSVVKSRNTWERAKKTCPGIDNGKRYTVQQIRVMREKVDI